MFSRHDKKKSLPDWGYISLEDPDMREFASIDPRGFIEAYPRRFILDEAQRVPDLFPYIQTHVDGLGERGVYVLIFMDLVVFK